MKKFVLFLIAACMLTSISAQQNAPKIPVKSITYKDMSLLNPQAKENTPLAGKKKAPKRKADECLVTPKGTLKYYEMSCVVRDFADGLMPVMNVAEKLYFDADGKTIYFGSLLPGLYFCDDFWAPGVLNSTGDLVTFDSSKTLYRAEYDEGNGSVYANLHLGELLFNEYEEPYGIQDLELSVNGETYYFDYTDAPKGLRSIVLFEADREGNVTVWGYIHYNNRLTPYKGNTELVQVPATAEIQDYTYTMQDFYGKEFVVKGQVAVDGKDYYFDSLIPDATYRGQKWVKGTRTGNTIKLQNDQFLGNDLSYYLYFAGLKTSGAIDDTGHLVGSKTNVSFTIDDKGVITLNNPNSTLPCAFYTSGGQCEYYFFRHRLEPFKGDVHARPANINNLRLNLRNLEKYGEFSIEFLVDNMTMDGDYIDPSKLSFCIYLDDEIYTFSKKDYPYIAWESVTNIPIDYTDATPGSASNDIYIVDDIHVVVIHEDMFNKVGVQMIYTVEGKEYRSGITYIDRNKVISVDDPEGIRSVNANVDASLSSFDLQGRKVTEMGRGIYVVKGKRIIR